MKIVINFCKSLLFSIFVIYSFNLMGSIIGFYIPINLITILFISLLGFVGFITIVVFMFFIL